MCKLSFILLFFYLKCQFYYKQSGQLVYQFCTVLAKDLLWDYSNTTNGSSLNWVIQSEASCRVLNFKDVILCKRRLCFDDIFEWRDSDLTTIVCSCFYWICNVIVPTVVLFYLNIYQHFDNNALNVYLYFSWYVFMDCLCQEVLWMI